MKSLVSFVIAVCIEIHLSSYCISEMAPGTWPVSSVLSVSTGKGECESHGLDSVCEHFLRD